MRFDGFLDSERPRPPVPDMQSPNDRPLRLQGGAVGEGFQVFLGLPLVLGGIVLLAKSWRYVPANLQAPPDELAKFLVGWVLVAGGALAAFGGEVWFLDSRSRTFERTWKFLRWPLRRRVVDFGRISAVRFSRQTGIDGAHHAFRVELAIEGGAPFPIANVASVGPALELSVRMAKAVGCAWEDTTSGKAVRRRPGIANESLFGGATNLSALDDGPVVVVWERERVEIRFGAGHLVAAGSGLPDEGEIAIPLDEIVSVEAGDRLVVLSRSHFLECGTGLPPSELVSLAETIRDRVRLGRFALQQR